MQKKREDTVSQYQSVQWFVCSHDMYMALVSSFHLFTSITSWHIAALYIFFFSCGVFDQSTVIIVTMFSKRINERLQVNERSGKAMNCDLSGFYWTYLGLVGFF